MPIKVFLSGNSRTITLKGTDPEFEDTPLYGQDVEITARTLTPVEEKRLERQFIKHRRGDIKVDTDNLLKERLTTMVTGWNGFVDEEGHPIPCTDEVKASIAANDPELARDILAAIKMRDEVKRQATAQELGN